MDHEFFTRSLYTDGTLLTAADLQTQQVYDGEKRRLLSRSFWGWGVVYGLSVQIDSDTLTIGPGLALDRDGYEIFLPQTKTVRLATLSGIENPAGAFLLCIAYAEHPIGQADAVEARPNRVRETYRFYLRPVSVEKAQSAAPIPEDAIADGTVVLSVLRFGTDGALLFATAPRNLFHPAPRPCAPEPPRPQRLVTGHIGPGSMYFKNGVWYSNEIEHGLGPGNVYITLAVLEQQTNKKCVFSGDLTLFGARIRTAVRVDIGKGTFVAAVRTGRFEGDGLQLIWYAQPAMSSEPEEQDPPAPLIPPKPPEPCEPVSPDPISPEPIRPPEQAKPSEPQPCSFRLEPSFAHLAPGEQIGFCPIFRGISQSGGPYAFRIHGTDGGTITDDGLYTAPPQGGLYHIEVHRLSTGEHADAYALVHDTAPLSAAQGTPPQGEHAALAREPHPAREAAMAFAGKPGTADSNAAAKSPAPSGGKESAFTGHASSNGREGPDG